MGTGPGLYLRSDTLAVLVHGLAQAAGMKDLLSCAFWAGSEKLNRGPAHTWSECPLYSEGLKLQLTETKTESSSATRQLEDDHEKHVAKLTSDFEKQIQEMSAENCTSLPLWLLVCSAFATRGLLFPAKNGVWRHRYAQGCLEERATESL